MTHPLTNNAFSLMEAAHETIHDSSQSIKTRRLALLMFEAMDDALARYGNDFDPERVAADLAEYVTAVPELPQLQLDAA